MIETVSLQGHFRSQGEPQRIRFLVCHIFLNQSKPKSKRLVCYHFLKFRNQFLPFQIDWVLIWFSGHFLVI